MGETTGQIIGQEPIIKGQGSGEDLHQWINGLLEPPGPEFFVALLFSSLGWFHVSFKQSCPSDVRIMKHEKDSRIQVKSIGFETLEPLNPGILEPYFSIFFELYCFFATRF